MELIVKKRSQKELFAIFEDILNKSGIVIIDKGNVDFGVKYLIWHPLLKENINMYVNLKNICGAGRCTKPFIKRIQTKEITNIIKTTDKQCYLLGGICFYGDKFLFACWNHQNYIDFKTIRSCYVFEESLLNAYKDGFYRSRDLGQWVYICNEDSFDKLILYYIENKIN